MGLFLRHKLTMLPEAIFVKFHETTLRCTLKRHPKLKEKVN